MKTKAIFIIVFLAMVLSTQAFAFASAQEEDEDIEILGLELEKVLALINAWIALFLAVFAFTAFRRDGRSRLFFVSLAFFLFSIKSFLIASELFIPEIGFIDPLAVVLEFGVLISFFYGVLKK